METNRVKQLIDAFYEGETSLEQEQELHRYFLDGDVPEELLEEKRVFLKLFSEKDNDINLPEGFGSRLENLIDDLAEKEKPKKKVVLWKQVAGIAASLTILISIGLYSGIGGFMGGRTYLVDTYSNPEDAYIEAQRTLELVSSKMNKGIDQLEKAEEEMVKAGEIIDKKLK